MEQLSPALWCLNQQRGLLVTCHYQLVNTRLKVLLGKEGRRCRSCRSWFHHVGNELQEAQVFSSLGWGTESWVTITFSHLIAAAGENLLCQGVVQVARKLCQAADRMGIQASCLGHSSDSAMGSGPGPWCDGCKCGPWLSGSPSLSRLQALPPWHRSSA